MADNRDCSPTKKWKEHTIHRRELLKMTGGGALFVGAGVGNTVAQQATTQTTAPDPEEYNSILANMEGDGSSANPYVVTAVDELQAMAGDLDGSYEMANDIDASGTAQWNDGDGFTPVSDAEFNYDNNEVMGDPFTGKVDGKGYKIQNLTVNRQKNDMEGLFGLFEGEVRNLTIENAKIHGAGWVGILAGFVRDDSLVENCSVTGTVEGVFNVGGLIGLQVDNGELVESSADVDVTGRQRIGGLIGVNFIESKITNCSASGSVEGVIKDEEEPGAIGGIVGVNQSATIMNSTASGEVKADGQSIGGLAGLQYADAEIHDSSASGNVTGYSDVGGLVGDSSADDNETPVITNSSAEGNVKGMDDGRTRAGGLVGVNEGRIEDSHSNGSVEGVYNVGGFLGLNLDGDIVQCHADGDVAAVGGGSEIEERADQSRAGGLVGNNQGTVTRSYATGDVDATGDRAGGLVGRNSGTIESSHAGGQIIGEWFVGSLLGWNESDAPVEKSYATGEISGTDYVGGFAGTAGSNNGIQDCYWDIESTGQQSGIGDGSGDVTGLQTEQMQGESATQNMADLDFEETWNVQTNPSAYPELDLSPSLDDYIDIETGKIETEGLRDAIDDWKHGEIETSLLQDVINAWQSGGSVE